MIHERPARHKELLAVWALLHLSSSRLASRSHGNEVDGLFVGEVRGGGGLELDDEEQG